MSTLVHSIRRRALVVGLVVASLAASGSAYAASAAPQLSNRPLPIKITGVVDGSLYGYANSYTPTPKFRKVPKIPQRPKVVVERTVVRCDVPVGTAHADDLWRCE
jgi:hypothetical protein